MVDLKCLWIYLDGVNLFFALFMFFTICILAMFLALRYDVASTQLTRLEIANKRLHRENELLKKEYDFYYEQFYVANFQLKNMREELDALKESQTRECEIVEGDNAD